MTHQTGHQTSGYELHWSDDNLVGTNNVTGALKFQNKKIKNKMIFIKTDQSEPAGDGNLIKKFISPNGSFDQCKRERERQYTCACGGGYNDILLT